MNQYLTKAIGIKDDKRENSYLFHVNEAEGLKDILDRDFDVWSDFDSWESIGVQQWIFARALDVHRGKNIDIKCDCCESMNSFVSNLGNIKKEKCYGKKILYMLDKLVGEIVLAKERRESDGTYSA